MALNTKLIRKLNDVTYEIDPGFVPNMKVFVENV